MTFVFCSQVLLQIVLSQPSVAAVPALSLGENHTLALHENGTVWGWGANSQGQLANAGGPTPTQVMDVSDVVKVSAGSDHSLVVKADGSIWAWGDNDQGQLGDGTKTDYRDYPVQVTSISSVIVVAAGYNHSIALKSDGTVWAWGNNARGQLGDGGFAESSFPVQVVGLTNVISIAAGRYCSIALKTDGTVWAWGENGSGQLGTGNLSDSNVPVQVLVSNIVAISCNRYHSLAIDSSGNIFGWGDNYSGQLGDGTLDDRSTPIQVSGLTNVVEVDAGYYHSMARLADNTVFSWGSNSFGELGDGTDIASLVPTIVPGLTGCGAIFAGEHYSGALKNDGSVWMWGQNSSGQMGTGQTSVQFTPKQLGTISDVSDVAAGYNHSIALKSDGTVWAWGNNFYGQLGDGTSAGSRNPVQVSGLTSVVKASCGVGFSTALKADGTVWAWGSNTSGQLGDGTTSDKTTPVQVSGLSDVSAVSSGGYHTLVLKNDNTVWAWGQNGSGQLGNGTTTGTSVPIQVSTLSNVIAVSAGFYHSLALKSDGTLWAWGRNDEGQLGEGTRTNRTTPVQISTLLNAAKISAGYDHSMAVKDDGSVWAWGNNSRGQLGDGTVERRETPVQVINLPHSNDLAVGWWASIAITENGFVKSWGDNTNGMLGIGSRLTETPSPVWLSLSNIAKVSSKDDHTIFLATDGTIYTSGFNGNGQLGDGGATWSPVPTIGPFNYGWLDLFGNSPIVNIAPIDSSNLDENSVHFKWTYLDGADNYELQVDDDNSFSSPDISETGILPNEYVNKTLSSGQYYWRVRGHFPDSTYSDWSETWSFNYSKPPLDENFVIVEQVDRVYSNLSEYSGLVRADAAAFSPDNSYFVYLHAGFRSDPTTIITDYEVRLGSNVLFSGKVEADNGFQIAWFDIISQPSISEDLELLFKPQTGGSSGFNAQIIAINLNKLDSSDWKYSVNTNLQQHTTAMTETASIMLDSADGNKDWMFFAMEELEVDSTSVNYQGEIFDGTTSYLSYSMEGEDLTERLTYALFRSFPDVPQNTQFGIRVRDDSTGINQHLKSRIFALNLDSFDAHEILNSQTDQELMPFWKDIGNLNAGGFFIPNKPGKHIVFASFIDATGSSSATTDYRLWIPPNGVSPNGWSWSQFSKSGHDSTDESFNNVAALVDIPSSGYSINLEAMETNGETQLADEVTLTVFSATYPEIVYPNPDPVNPQQDSSVSDKYLTFEWSAVSGAVGYEIRVDNDSAFGSPEINNYYIDGESTTSLVFKNHLPGNTYYWQIRAKFGEGEYSPWSDNTSFNYDIPVAPEPVWVPLYRYYKGGLKKTTFTQRLQHRVSTRYLMAMFTREWNITYLIGTFPAAHRSYVSITRLSTAIIIRSMKQTKTTKLPNQVTTMKGFKAGRFQIVARAVLSFTG